MKKAFALLLAAVLLLTAGCVSAAKTPSTAAPTAETAPQTTAAPATEPASTEPAPTEPVSTEPVATEPAPTEPAPTEAPVPETEAPTAPAETEEPTGPAALVGLMFSLQYELPYFIDFGSQDFSCRVPCIQDDTEGARAINADIREKYVGVLTAPISENPEELYIVDYRTDYEVAVSGDILTLIIRTESVFDTTDHNIYSYDTATGQWLGKEDLLDRWNLSEADFRALSTQKIRERVGELTAGMSEQTLEDAGYADYLELLDRGATYSYLEEMMEENATVYPRDGDLVAVVPMFTPAGAGYCWVELPLGLTD